MKRLQNYLRAFYEIINSDLDEVLKEVEPYKDKIREMKMEIEYLISKNLAEAKISRGREIQKKFDSLSNINETLDTEELLIAARTKDNEENYLNLSDEEKQDLINLRKISGKND